MGKTAGNILRSGDVRIEGVFHLDLQDTSPAAAQPRQGPANLAEPHVIILENHPEFALLEITCSCGAKSRIKCRYDSPQSQNNVSTQTETKKEPSNAS